MKLRLVSLLFLLISFGALFYVILSINGQNVTVSDPRVTEARVSGTHLSTEKVRNTANIEENMRRNEDVVHSVSRGSDFLNNRQCPELASNTGDQININIQNVNMKQVEDENKNVLPGGMWAPITCTSYQSLVIIVPYKDREDHLSIFLRHIHPFLQAQMLNYSILLLEQTHPNVFNRGALLNIGFLEARKLWPEVDCVIFHDVDLLPEHYSNLYRCRETPLHLGAFVDTANYRVYKTIVGGVLAVRPHHMFLTNGFSNTYWGWGGEDDDMYNRIAEYRKMRILYPDPVIGRLTMIKHHRDKSNPLNHHNAMGRKVHGTNYAEDGLNSVMYDVINVIQLPLYTNITISIHVGAKAKEELSNLVKYTGYKDSDS